MHGLPNLKIYIMMGFIICNRQILLGLLESNALWSGRNL